MLEVIRSRDLLRLMMAWAERVPLPPATGVAPWPAPAAAVEFVLLQIGAIVVHLTGDRRMRVCAARPGRGRLHR
ncbi:hypothetical protein ACIBSV_43760 [Embleya sp. NPDC050154]|uniref:hypothetical protein n=1 Tax=Embleya sp. NPDC050154 TaxID=3363988 RepID=UPI0037B5BBF5